MGIYEKFSIGTCIVSVIVLFVGIFNDSVIFKILSVALVFISLLFMLASELYETDLEEDKILSDFIDEMIKDNESMNK